MRKLVADLSLDKEALQSVIKKADGARSHEGSCQTYAASVQSAPGVRPDDGGGVELSISVTTLRLGPTRKVGGTGSGEAALRLPASARSVAPERRMVKHKRVHRVNREAGLALRRKKRKHCVRQSAPLRQYTKPNHEWAIDFAHDAVAAGRAIRVLSVVDAYTGSAWRWKLIQALPAAA